MAWICAAASTPPCLAMEIISSTCLFSLMFLFDGVERTGLSGMAPRIWFVCGASGFGTSFTAALMIFVACAV